MSKKRHYSLNKLSKFVSYPVDDVARLYRIHPQTVLKWIKQGLHKTDNKKPILIHGSVLKGFLGYLNTKNKVHTNFEEMFCFHFSPLPSTLLFPMPEASRNPYHGTIISVSASSLWL